MSIEKNKNANLVSLGSHDIFYKIQGHGPRILLITGTNSDTRYKPTIFEAPGASEFELLNFDHRGMGQSSSPDENPTMASYADDIARFLEKIGWQETMVIGISFGGMVAQHFALRHPQKVRKLVLCCTSSGGDGGSSYPLHTLQEGTAEDYASTTMKLMNVQHTDIWQQKNPDDARRIYDFYWQGANATFNAPKKHAAMKLQFAARAQHDVHEHLKTIDIPTLVACGKYDGIALPKNSQSLAEIIPKARLETFEGGHIFLKEDPTAWPIIFSFLKENIS